MIRVDRRRFLQFAMLSAAGLSSVAMAGCGSDSASGELALRYGGWGDNIRQRNYTEALKQFSQAHPDILVQPEFAEYNAFQERMTTQIAAREVPDIFWIASPQVLTYHKSKLYRKLDDIPTLDLSAYAPQEVESFKIGGELNTMPFGVFVPVVRYNETFADQDGVTIPTEGPGWTWDALAQLLLDYSKNNAAKRKGLPYTPHGDLPFEAWLRQRGEQLWTEDGRLGWTVDGLASWLDWWEKLRQGGATLSISEQEGMDPDWELVGDKVLLNFGNSNHIIDEATMFPDYTFRLRPAPTAPGAASGHKFLYFPRMAIYRGIDDEKVEAAGRMINYNTNDIAMLRTVGMTMGAPVNPKIAQEVLPNANPNEKEMLAVVQSDRAVERKPRYEAPPGSSTWRTAMSRVCEGIALGRTNVTDGAKTLIDEINAGIERAQ
ncbi:ABC transporter substrate-binding protein [Saccharopolyspora sp. K220]|uniref:ABC transporter substrate-binding protein n=1 Tax=Saccharopolyspora soli TaxID=2926618 RepID=UPI001F5634C3|nr:ABC transporter substrate-binding protein [Saccharopolyspora soli]MCI2419575.1 ABC transporter substrate-binding protein [Saccharopolyspora soli]